MYSFEPNEEQQMLVDAVGKYANNDLRPAAHDAEESLSLIHISEPTRPY